MDDLAPLATGVGDGDSPKLGQELLHNVGLMVGLAETEIQVRKKQIPEGLTKTFAFNIYGNVPENVPDTLFVCLFVFCFLVQLS